MTSTELKHQANLQQWSQDIQDCRASRCDAYEKCTCMHLVIILSFTKPST